MFLKHGTTGFNSKGHKCCELKVDNIPPYVEAVITLFNENVIQVSEFHVFVPLSSLAFFTLN